MIGRPVRGRLVTPAATTAGDKVAIVVVNWNGRAFLQRALESIAAYTCDEQYELIVVDNGSQDDSLDYLRTFRAPHATRVEIIANPTNRFFSAAFNQGFNAAAADARYLMLFCNDVEAKERGWLGDFVTAIQGPGVVAAGHVQTQELEAQHRDLLLSESPDYGDPVLAARMRTAATDPATRYAHLSGYSFLLDRNHLYETGLYLEGGAFRQYHSDWELYLRFHVLGLRVAFVQPRLHHWHSISELIAEHPERYRELVASLDDEATLAEWLRAGRTLFAEESGYRAWRAQRDGEA